MNSLWFVGLMGLFAVSVISQNDMFQLPKRQDGMRRFCGTHLADTLALLCHGSYNGWSSKSKKDGSWIDMTSDDYDQPLSQPEWPFLSHQSAASFMPEDAIYRRYRRGVYDECCKKPCSVSVLRTYCGPNVIQK